MFKKQPNLKTSNNIKSSDLKKLNKDIVSKALLLDDIPCLAADEYTIDAKSVQKTQFESTVSKGVVYSATLKSKDSETSLKIPTWIQITSLSNDYKLFNFNKALKNKFELFPTVYTTWLYEDLIPVVVTNSYVLDEVIMINGSDLSIRGCALPNQYNNFYNDAKYVNKLVKGTVVGIADYKQPKFVKAVGILMEDADKVGETGMIVTVLHTWNDFLKRSFDVSFEPPKRVKEVSIDSDDDHANDEGQNEDKEDMQTKESHEEKEDVKKTLTAKEVDEYLNMALYYIITQKVKIEFPCSGSNFISQYILNYIPYDAPVEQINVKNSTYKKAAKLFKSWEKSSFIKIKTSKNGDAQIMGMISDPETIKKNENLRVFISYKPLIESSIKKANDKTKTEKINFISASILYKPKTGDASRLVMYSEEQDYYSQTELKSAIDRYITENGLFDTKIRKQVKLDDCLAKLLKSKSEDYVDKKDIAPKILANASAFNFFFQVYKDLEKAVPMYHTPIKTSLLNSTIPPMEILPIIIKQESSRNKIITRISNLWAYNIDMKQLATVLKLKCNASVTFEELKVPTHSAIVNNFEDSNDEYKITSYTKLNIIKSDILVQGPHEKLVLEILKTNNKINVNSPVSVKAINTLKGRRKHVSST
ncbi:uncharacterized protein HGUI_01385 [Hanseniaspora guilliermondii]|uniref:Uncharacterized protein n=1 Tax=Hanseniaspora guilliermondii TaxID=56406 RepID=A0A1L0CLC0_9ASCO|nr:uncharacterized protein HGUI_01385 [Hanseniaspora guilliermondii]